ncbi:hypothetical protein DVH05_006365 [Phytophthora capsici]|nr:hypothetical protein DVH05_006365 [Phytophthora capsici]
MSLRTSTGTKQFDWKKKPRLDPKKSREMTFPRLYVIVLLVVVMISNSTATRMTSRHLRGMNDVPREANTEERGPNVDIMISDAAKKVKKATWWKVKHAFWKHILQKDPYQVREDLGMKLMGQQALVHKNAEELKAFRKTYGKGLLKYP